MKKFLIMVFFAVTLCLAVSACGVKTVRTDENSVIITATSSVIEITDKTTLAEYMNALKNKNEIKSFTINSGMVTEINGICNTSTEFWLIYTSDGDNAEQTWGSVIKDGEEYFSAKFGAEELIVKSGETYVWAFVSFS